MAAKSQLKHATDSTISMQPATSPDSSTLAASTTHQLWMKMTLAWLFHCRPAKAAGTIEVYLNVWLDVFSPDVRRPSSLRAWIQRAQHNDPAAIEFLESLIEAALSKCAAQVETDLISGQPDGAKAPWLFEAVDAERYAESLTHPAQRIANNPREVETRRNARSKKLSPGTISQRVAALSSYFAYGQKFLVVFPDAAERPLRETNPIESLSRQKVVSYQTGQVLMVEQVRQFLSVVERDRSLTGLRNNALFLACIYTALRVNEITEWRWGDIVSNAKEHTVRVRIKNDFQIRDLPAPVYEAILVYLRVGGRLETIKADDYLFVAHNERVRQLKREGRRVVDEKWQPGATPISRHEIGRLLKRYGHAAGLDKTELHPHVLRHTAAMLRVTCGDDPAAISQLLSFARRETAKTYIEQLHRFQPIAWRKVESLIS